MKIGKAGKVVGFIASIAGAGALVGAAAMGTGAYFSDSHDGAISGHLGTIRINTQDSAGTGGQHLNFNWSSILPGEWQTATITVKNTGDHNTDVWLTFPNQYALHSLNTLGRYGEVSVGGHLYDNLNDICGVANGCNPLPKQVRVANNLAPDASTTFTFNFRYATALTTDHQGEAFNCYQNGSPSWLNTKDTIPCSLANSSGLPYQVVGTQHGIAPDDAGSKF